MGAVTFTTEDGVRLEGEVRLPEGEVRATAVICHPHPKHGGSKDHPILWALRNELAGHHGVAVLGFNFRGVMGSGGVYGGGHGELLDLRAALTEVRELAPGRPSIVLGWSFGANVALRGGLDDPRVGGLVLIGIPLRPNDLALPPLPSPAERGASRRPVLVVCGDNDGYCPAGEARTFVECFPDARLEVLAGTDHFLWRREREAAELVGRFVDGTLQAERGPDPT